MSAVCLHARFKARDSRKQQTPSVGPSGACCSHRFDVLTLCGSDIVRRRVSCTLAFCVVSLLKSWGMVAEWLSLSQ